MPDIVLHNAIGDQVVSRLALEIRALLNPSVFRFSVMGPDPYGAYRFFFISCLRKGINKRSRIMHWTKTGEYLMELVKYIQSDNMFSFLAGFLCHYATDYTYHPIVYKMQGCKAFMHTAIEHRLDVIELEKQGKQKKDIMELFTHFPEDPEIRWTIKKIYGWDDDYYRTSYQYMKLQHWIYKDQHKLWDTFFGWTNGKMASRSYSCHLCDGMDLSVFDELEEKAINLSIELITSAYQYKIGKLDEKDLRSVFGNRSYSGIDDWRNDTTRLNW